ncbi:hypothetical protein AB1Y20_000171 [Prymnesium parvum]|uniref:Uncharacterized protein n=1 Tax=Prymnesium parvum TaxID=97485 RepID=A0AB34K4P5_PRYPA|mmetsp:Transcript_42481/g.105762  ORF Transcript_42481/g.105762 Transcript_42481/m.105762 type:complete len:178 (-) Transcript_42481:229-762(-)
MLALLCGLAAYQAPSAGRPAVARASTPAMKVTNFDQDGQFSELPQTTKPPLKILTRVEELRVLSNLADAGLLSAAEDAGVFTKLENAGAFATAEKLLPLADKFKLLSTAEKLLNSDSSSLVVAAAALLGAEIGLIALVPDDNSVLVGVQIATGVLAGAGAVTLVAVSSLFKLLQEEA